MADKIVDFVQANEQVQYDYVWLVVMGYFLIFWLIVTIWAASDAKKRYQHRKYLPYAWSLIILAMNLPALLFYLMVRPQNSDIANPLTEEHDNELVLPLKNMSPGQKLILTMEVAGKNAGSISKVERTAHTEQPPRVSTKQILRQLQQHIVTTKSDTAQLASNHHKEVHTQPDQQPQGWHKAEPLDIAPF